LPGRAIDSVLDIVAKWRMFVELLGQALYMSGPCNVTNPLLQYPRRSINGPCELSGPRPRCQRHVGVVGPFAGIEPEGTANGQVMTVTAILRQKLQRYADRISDSKSEQTTLGTVQSLFLSQRASARCNSVGFGDGQF